MEPGTRAAVSACTPADHLLKQVREYRPSTCLKTTIIADVTAICQIQTATGRHHLFHAALSRKFHSPSLPSGADTFSYPTAPSSVS